MVLINSSSSTYGKLAPPFCLPEPLTGKIRSLEEFECSVGALVVFICNHCPYVHHIQLGLIKLASEFQEQGIDFVAINSNDRVAYPEDSPDNMKRIARELGYPFPYLYDESQEVAKSYNATCTPDFYVLDAGKRFVYRGQMDDSRPGSDIPEPAKDLRLVFEALLLGKKVQDVLPDPKPSVGCSIKWKP